MTALTPGRLAAWDASALGSAARGLRADAEVLREVERVVRRAVDALVLGRGLTADAQRRTGLAHALLAGRVADEAELDAGAIQAAAEVIDAAARLLARAVRLADRAGLRVDGDGRVDPGPDPDDERAGLAGTCSALARQALAAAEEGDADAARALLGPRGVRGAQEVFSTLRGGRRTLIVPTVAGVRERRLPQGATAADRAGWWEATPPGERRRLVAEGVPGGEGLPPGVRDAVNRARLTAELLRVHRLLAGRRPTPAQVVLQDRLRVLLSIRSALEQHPEAALLSFRSTEGSGRAIVAVGDVDRADHVAVLVPGLTGWVPGYLGGLLRDAQRVRAQAERYENGSVAAVAWIGYQAPGFRDVALAGAARAGVADLRQTLAALQARADVRGHAQSVTLLGHSYGSLLAGLAARDASGIDDLVLLGSPGSGAHRASQLSVPAGHVWVGEGRYDPVADLGRFGTDPGLGAFGAVRLPTGEGHDPALGTPLSTSTGHSQYYAVGSGSLASIGLVVAGRGGLLRPGSWAPGPVARPQAGPGPAGLRPATARTGAPPTPR